MFKKITALTIAIWAVAVWPTIAFANQIDRERARLNQIMQGYNAPASVPIGGMVAVMPTIDGAAWQPPATGVIKDGFMRADGHQITAQNVTDGAKFSLGTYLPQMVAMTVRGGTTSCDGSIACASKTGGSDSVTPTGSVSQPTFTGAAVARSAWFKTTSIAATFTGTAAAHSNWFKTDSIGASFVGTAATRADWFKTTALSSTFTGTGVARSTWFNTTALSGTVDIAHGHGFTQPSDHAAIDIAHPHGFTQPTISRTTNVALTNSAFNLPAHYHGLGTGSGLTAAGQTLATTNVSLASGAAAEAGAHTHSQTIYNNTNQAGGTLLTGNSTSTNPYSYVTAASAGAHTHTVSGTTNIGHTHAASSVSGTIGLVTGGCNGNITGGAGSCTATSNVTVATQPEFGASAGAVTALGVTTRSVAFSVVNDTMDDWATTGNYTPAGSVSQPTFTGNSQGNLPDYQQVVWVIRVY